MEKGYEVRISWDDPYLAKVLSGFRKKLKERVRVLGGILVEGERETRIYFSQNSFSYYCLKELREFVNLMEVKEVKLPRRVFLDLYAMENTKIRILGDRILGKIVTRFGPFLVAVNVSLKVSERALLEDSEEEIKRSLLFSPRDRVIGKPKEVSKEKALCALRGRRDPKRVLGIKLGEGYYLPEDLMKVLPWEGKCSAAGICGATKVFGEEVEVPEGGVITGSGKYEDAFEAVSDRAKPYLSPKERIIVTYHDKASKDFCEEIASYGIAEVEVEPYGTEVEGGCVISDSGPYRYFLGKRRRDPFRLLLMAIEEAGGWYCISSQGFPGPMRFIYFKGGKAYEKGADADGLPAPSPEARILIGNAKGMRRFRVRRREDTLKIVLRTTPGVFSSSKGIFKAGPYYFICPIPRGICYCLKGSEEKAKILYELCLLNPHFQVNRYLGVLSRPPYHLQVLRRSTTTSSFLASSSEESQPLPALSAH